MFNDLAMALRGKIFPLARLRERDSLKFCSEILSRERETYDIPLSLRKSTICSTLSRKQERGNHQISDDHRNHSRRDRDDGDDRGRVRGRRSNLRARDRGRDHHSRNHRVLRERGRERSLLL